MVRRVPGTQRGSLNGAKSGARGSQEQPQGTQKKKSKVDLKLKLDFPCFPAGFRLIFLLILSFFNSDPWLESVTYTEELETNFKLHSRGT